MQPSVAICGCVREGEPLLDKQTRLAAAETVKRMLLFSQLFFGAFPVEREREKCWQFLHFILQTQENGRLRKSHLTSGNKDFAHVLEDAADKNKALAALLDCFNEDRVFLEPVEGKQIRAYELTTAFDNAVKDYLLKFFALFHSGLPHQVDGMNVATRRDLLKSIFSFQFEDLYPAWTNHIEALANQRAKSEKQKKEFASELGDRPPYWAITLMCWEKFLRDPHNSFDLVNINNGVKDVMLTSNPIEVVECFNFLSRDDVAFFVPADRPKKYRFSESYTDVMLAYTKRVDLLESQLQVLAIEKLREAEQKIQERSA